MISESRQPLSHPQPYQRERITTLHNAKPQKEIFQKSSWGSCVRAGDFLGQSVSIAGDVNGDLIDDLIIAAPGADPGLFDEGQIYVVFGRCCTPSIFDVNQLALADQNAGLIMNGIAPGDAVGGTLNDIGTGRFQRSRSNAIGIGDLNGDGVDDIVISTPNADFASKPMLLSGSIQIGASPGETYVVFGRPDIGRRTER